jgi:RsiW-degrading membrane proteinase PrsW (M82 family)
MVKRTLDYLKTLPGKVTDAIVVPLLVVLVLAVVAFLVAAATNRHAPVWALVAALVVGFIAGSLITKRNGGHPVEPAPSSSPYDTYVEHVRRAAM